MIIPDNIKTIMQKLLDNNYEAYIIGGACRDHYLGIEPHDYDIFTNATGEQILEVFPQGKVLGGEERQAKILTVIVDGVEVSQYRSNGDRTETGTSLEQHQSTCDFTMNSIACNIDGEVKDPYGGASFIQQRLVIWVGKAEDRINEDPLRIMRMFRFASKYNMEFSPLGVETISKILTLPKERVREELMKILELPNLNVDSLHYLFEVLFPFYKESLLLEGGRYHDETVGDHLFHSLKEACKVTTNPLLRLEPFAHDCGKYATVSHDEKGIHFYQHHKVGADIMKDWMKEYKFSSEEIKYVTTIIYNHMHGYMGGPDGPSKKSYIKLFSALDEGKVPIEDFVTQLYCDNQGNQAKPRIKYADFLRGNRYLKKYYELKHSTEPFKITELVIKGKDLISRGVPQGPELGKILQQLYDKVLEGELKNQRGELLAWVRDNVILQEDQQKRELVIFVGLPASGKSTYFKNNYFGTHIHINLDTTIKRSKEWKMFKAAMDANLNIVVDNTNMTKEFRKRYVDEAKHKYVIRCVHFMVDKEVCIERNSQREGDVPESAIHRFAEEYEQPTLDEGFRTISKIIQDNK